MSVLDLDTYKQALRELRSDSFLDQAMQADLDAAEHEASNFLGFSIEEAYDSFTLPPDVGAAIFALAQRFSDSVTPEYANHLTGTAYSLLRPYRIDTGV